MALLMTDRQKMLIAVLEATHHSSNLDKLQKTASAMFPEEKWGIYCHATAGRGFMDEEGNLRKDLSHAVGDGPDVVAVFKNGDVIPC